MYFQHDERALSIKRGCQIKTERNDDPLDGEVSLGKLITHALDRHDERRDTQMRRAFFADAIAPRGATTEPPRGVESTGLAFSTGKHSSAFLFVPGREIEITWPAVKESATGRCAVTRRAELASGVNYFDPVFLFRPRKPFAIRASSISGERGRERERYAVISIFLLQSIAGTLDFLVSPKSRVRLSHVAANYTWLHLEKVADVNNASRYSTWSLITSSCVTIPPFDSSLRYNYKNCNNNKSRK